MAQEQKKLKSHHFESFISLAAAVQSQSFKALFILANFAKAPPPMLKCMLATTC